MAWGMVAVAGASLVSGYMGAEASEDAAHAQAQAGQAAAGVSRQNFQESRGDLAPYRQVGGDALRLLAHLTGFGDYSKPKREQFKTDAEFDAAMAKYEGGLKDRGALARPIQGFKFGLKEFQADPGYQFRLEEGEKSIQRGALSRGMDASTGTLKSLTRYNQGLASDEFNRAYGRGLQSFTTNFGVETANRERTSGLLQFFAGSGQNAAAMTGTLGANSANTTANALINSGNAAAQGIMGSASSWNNAIQGGLSNYMYQQRWDQMMNRFPVFSGGTSSTAGPMNWGNTGGFSSGQAVG